MTNNITISKGVYFVTIFTNGVTDNYTNKLISLNMVTTTQNQEVGSKSTKIIDLLRIEHAILIKGYITGSDSASSTTNDTGGSISLTAKQIKDNLIAMIKGAGVNGGECSIVYAGNTFLGYIEKCTMIENSFDEPNSLTTDIVKYEVDITLLEGIRVG